MWPLVITLGAVGALVLILGSSSSVDVVAGKSYRFFWRVKPALDVTAADALMNAIALIGGGSATMQQGSGETVGSYVQKAVASKKIDIGKPSIVLGGNELVFTGIVEVPS